MHGCGIKAWSHFYNLWRADPHHPHLKILHMYFYFFWGHWISFPVPSSFFFFFFLPLNTFFCGVRLRFESISSQVGHSNFMPHYRDDFATTIYSYLICHKCFVVFMCQTNFHIFLDIIEWIYGNQFVHIILPLDHIKSLSKNGKVLIKQLFI